MTRPQLCMLLALAVLSLACLSTQAAPLRGWPGVGRDESDASVRAVQYLLAAHGGRVAVDGVFGPQMKAVTKTYQSRTGHTADGFIGRNTWYELLGGTADAGNDNPRRP